MCANYVSKLSKTVKQTLVEGKVRKIASFGRRRIKCQECSQSFEQSCTRLFAKNDLGRLKLGRKRKWGTAKKTKWMQGEMLDLIYPANIAKIYVAHTSNKSDEI